MVKLVDFHRHTHWSLLDGVTKIDDLIDLCIKRKYKAVCVSDHGTLAGTYKLWDKCKKKQIKPIMACEAYWVEDYDSEDAKIKYNYGHIVIIALNEKGWKNLKKLQALAWEEGFYCKPRITINQLCAHNEGLAVTTGCLDGIVGHYYLGMNKFYEDAEKSVRRKKAVSVLKKVKKAFGDRLYAEIQLNDMDNQVKLNKYVYKLAKKYGLDIIVTQDGHYLEKDDTELHDTMKCILWHETLNDPNAHIYETRELWYKTFKELDESRNKWHDWITTEELVTFCANTEKLADRVEEYSVIPTGSPLPVISETPDEDLLEVCKTHKLFNKLMKKKAYKKRFYKEYETIVSLDFSNYFLVVHDVVKFSRANGIPYNGRGSVNGSLIAFFMGITWIDPIKLNCPFERFLTKDRLSLPDIDMDFGKNERQKIVEYTREKYGEECVAHIGNYLKWKPKGAIKDAGRVLGMNFAKVNAITTDMDDDVSEWDDLDKYPVVLDYLRENEDLERIAKNLMGLNRQNGTHASGVVITPTDITDWLPIAYSLQGGGKAGKSKKEKVTEWDMYDLEDAGILKMDYLGSTTLDVISHAIKLINAAGDKEFTCFDELCMKLIQNTDDKKVYELISNAENVGLFQLGTSDGMMALSKDIMPTQFEDIIITISLYRTAVLQVGMHTEYVRRRFGKHYQLEHEKMHSVLDDSMGVMIFQEQTMNLAVVLAGFSGAEADHFRKGIKLKDTSKIKAWKNKFVKGCKTFSDIDKETALRIWGFIEAFSGYGFCRAHAASYAFIAYVSAYLKVHYPKEYMASLLTYAIDDDKKLMTYLKEARRLKLKLQYPDINRSTKNFKICKSGLLYPLHAIKGLGGKALECILEERENGKFEDFEDFYNRVSNRTVHIGILTNLVLSGCFRKFGSKSEIFNELIELRGKESSYRQVYCFDCKKRYPVSVTKKAFENDGIVCPNCGSIQLSSSYDLCEDKEFDDDFLLSTIFGFVFKESPLKKYTDVLIKEHAAELSEIEEIEEGSYIKTAFEIVEIKTHTDSKGGKMAFLSVSDGNYATDLTVFSSDWEDDLEKQVKKGRCYLGTFRKNRGKLLFNSRMAKMSLLTNKRKA